MKRNRLINYAKPLPQIGARFENSIVGLWSFTVVGMYPRSGEMIIVAAFDAGYERCYKESQFRLITSQPGWKFNDMKEFTVP